MTPPGVNSAGLAQLRQPFKANQIGKLPKVLCRNCTDNKTERHCPKHEVRKCATCKAYLTTAHTHIEYVGHATATDRLLQVDPHWSWEPMAFGPDGLPAVDKLGGLWIRLTVCGVTRPGYGHADGKSGGNAVKETIGDAIRNAAMRFGVALQLWAKNELTPQEPVHESPTSERASVIAHESLRAVLEGPPLDPAAVDRSEGREPSEFTITDEEVLTELAAKVEKAVLDGDKDAGLSVWKLIDEAGEKQLIKPSEMAGLKTRLGKLALDDVTPAAVA